MADPIKQLKFSPLLAEAFTLLPSAVWVIDPMMKRIEWANSAALELWNAPSLLALQQRDWQDYGEFSKVCPQQYLERFQRGETITEKWDFLQTEPFSVLCCCSGIILDYGRLGILVQGIQHKMADSQQQREIQALIHAGVSISLHPLSGAPLFQNQSDFKTYGSKSLQDRFCDQQLWAQAIRQINRGKAFFQKAQMDTSNGPRWHLVNLCQIKDPMTREPLILVNESDLTTIHRSEQSYRLLADYATDLISLHCSNGRYFYASPACQSLLGYLPTQLVGRNIKEFVHPEDRSNLERFYRKLKADQPGQRITYRMLSKNHKYLWVETTAKIVPSSEHPGTTEMICVSRDVTEQKQTEQLLNSQKQILEKIALGDPLQETLNLLITNLEAQTEGMYGSVMILNADGIHLHFLAGAKLPQGYVNYIDGIEISPNLGSCGRAVYQRQIIISQDVRLDSCWQGYAEIAYSYGLRSCWSVPIFFGQEEVLGTFAMYFSQARSPSPYEEHLIATASYLAGMAIKHHQVQQTLQKAEEKYRSIFENVTQGIYQSSLEGYYLNANPALAKMYGYDSPEDLITSILDIANQVYVNPHRRHDLMELLKTEPIVKEFESQVYCRDGSTIWISESARIVTDQLGQFLYYEGTVEDITQRRQSEEQLLQSAFSDLLTGLPNRGWFIEQLNRNIELVGSNLNYDYGVLFIDLDGFKLINDALGHLVGDELLKKVAQRLQSSLLPPAQLARFGGDEFAVLIPQLKDIQEAITAAESLLNSLKLPFYINQQEFFTGASIGITLGRFGYEQTKDVLKDADLAMYKAKEKGKGCYVIFSRDMHISAQDNWQLANDFRRGIEREEFSLFYQPIIVLESRRIVGFEALLRWHHPTRGMIGPGQFIPLAEETGFIGDLGFWVFKSACLQLRNWQILLPEAQDLIININISPQQFKQDNFLNRIKLILQETQVNPHSLNLEITESCFLETSRVQTELMTQIQNLGINFCIDDFGTGYSSLARLHEFPISSLKIDRCFVESLLHQSRQTAIVQTIITLGENLGMKVVAEGIETKSQLLQLQQLGCRYGQGFLFSAPVAKGKATELLIQGIM